MTLVKKETKMLGIGLIFAAVVVFCIAIALVFAWAVHMALTEKDSEVDTETSTPIHEDGETVPGEYVFINGKRHHLVYSEDGRKVAGPELGRKVKPSTKLTDWKKPDVKNIYKDGELDTRNLSYLEELDENHVLMTLDELLDDSQ